jgi:hypothetical protein
MEENDATKTQRAIAKKLLEIHGDKAFMLALIEMEDAHELRRRNWRKILTLMEEMKGETK